MFLVLVFWKSYGLFLSIIATAFLRVFYLIVFKKDPFLKDLYAVLIFLVTLKKPPGRITE